MTFKEFESYMRKNLRSSKDFCKKAYVFQQRLNKNRDSKKRLSDEQLKREVQTMWENAMRPLYEKIDSDRKRQSFESFIREYEILEAVDNEMCDVEFEVEI